MDWSARLLELRPRAGPRSAFILASWRLGVIRNLFRTSGFGVGQLRVRPESHAKTLRGKLKGCVLRFGGMGGTRRPLPLLGGPWFTYLSFLIGWLPFPGNARTTVPDLTFNSMVACWSLDEITIFPEATSIFLPSELIAICSP